MGISHMGSGLAAYPIGGSLPLSRAVEQRYLDLGGEVFYKSKVEKILIEDNKAVGVLLENGQEERGDIVISAADGHTTLFDWLNGKYMDNKIQDF